MSWAEEIRNVHEDAGGLFEIVILTPDVEPELRLRAALGEVKALTILQLMEDASARIVQSHRSRPALCLCCPDKLGGGRFTCGAAIPARTDAAAAIVFGVCERCAAGDPNGVLQRVLAPLRIIWPDLRMVEVTHQTAGRA